MTRKNTTRVPRTPADRKQQNIARREAKRAEREGAAIRAAAPPTPYLLGQQPTGKDLYDAYIDAAVQQAAPAPTVRKPAGASVFNRVYWWTYRHRVELAPFAAGAGLLAVAAAAHHTGHHGHHPAAGWVTVASGLGNAAVWLPRVGAKWDREIERKYVRAVTAASGTWASVASVVGPDYLLLVVLLIGVIVAGVPWWRHKLVRPAEPGDADDAEAEAAALLAHWARQWVGVRDRLGLERSRVIAAIGSAEYVQLTIQLVPGVQLAEDVKNMRAKIAGALRLGTRSVRVETVKTDASLVKVFLVKTSPIAVEVRWSDAVTMLPTSLQAPATFVLGRDETGKWLRVDPRGHWMIIGESRSGKSNGLHALMANITACPEACAVMADLKGGSVAKRWAASLAKPVADTPAKAERLLKAIDRMIDQRPAFAPVDEGDGDQLDPTEDMPAMFVVIDEFAEIKTKAPHLIPVVESIARRGAAVGFYLVLVAQDGSLESFGTEALRGQLTRRLCYRVAKADNAQYVLTGWSKLAVTSLESGQFFWHHREDVETPVRAPFMTPEDNRRLPQQIATEHAAHRPELDARTATAAGELWSTGWDELGATSNRTATPGVTGGQHADTPTGGNTVQNPAQAAAEAEAAELFGDLTSIPTHVERFTAEQIAAELASAEDRFAAAFVNAPVDGLDRKTLIGFCAMSASWVDERLTALTDREVLRRIARGRYAAAAGRDVRAALAEHADRKRAALV